MSNLSVKFECTIINDASTKGDTTGETSPACTVEGIIRGREELSSLYFYEVLVTCESEKSIRASLGARASIVAYIGDSANVVSINGIIMSVEKPSLAVVDNYKNVKKENAYTLVIRPEFAKSCYSVNRWAWNISDVPPPVSETNNAVTGQPTLAGAVLEHLAARWNTTIKFSNTAENILASIKPYVLRQNDESDYNFFSRLLATWGLGYILKPCGDEVTINGKTVQKEILYVFNATEPDTECFNYYSGGEQREIASSIFTSGGSAPSFFWKLNYGMQSHGVNAAALHNYSDAKRIVQTNDEKISLHDETWDMCLEESQNKTQILRYMSQHDNADTCHGCYETQLENTAANVASIRLVSLISHEGKKFTITRLRISATKSTWKVEIDGRCPSKYGNYKTLGLGTFPRPIRLNNHPDSCDEELISDEPWPEPRMRVFMAIVQEETKLPSCDINNNSLLKGRNLCYVSELPFEKPESWLVGGGGSKTSAADRKYPYFWVELISPHADADSGILARPRKGNVLICLDRGDLSIPIALGAMFRNNNSAPFAQLKQMDRESRTDDDDLIDYGALTLRSRTHTQPKEKTSSNAAAVSPAEHDTNATIESSDVLDITRPLSVHDLAKKQHNFSQIQLVSKSHGIKPVKRNKHATDTYLASGIVETALGLGTEANFSGAYSMASIADMVQQAEYLPITRPHLEGISMYSNSDLLIQSADHQIVNAGGEIVLTAAQAITLRVGTSCIKLTQAGIEISCKTGKVMREGAYSAYHPSKEAETRYLFGSSFPLGGNIWVDFSGVNTQGPYIANAAINMFTATTLLGSSFNLSDYSASLYAPKTTVVGGAALADTLSNGIQGVLNMVDDASSTHKGSDDGEPYTGPVEGGCKKKWGSEIAWEKIATRAAPVIWESVKSVVGSVKDGGARYKALFSVSGSMVKLEADNLTITSKHGHIHSGKDLTIGTASTAPYAAMAERAGTDEAVSWMDWVDFGVEAGSAFVDTVGDACRSDNTGEIARVSIMGFFRIIGSFAGMFSKCFAKLKVFNGLLLDKISVARMQMTADGKIKSQGTKEKGVSIECEYDSASSVLRIAKSEEKYLTERREKILREKLETVNSDISAVQTALQAANASNRADLEDRKTTLINEKATIEQSQIDLSEIKSTIIQS